MPFSIWGGVISAPFFDWKFNIRYGKLIKQFVIVVFAVLLVVGQIHDNFHLLLYKRVAAGIGVFAVLFLCEQISEIIFTKQREESEKRNSKLQNSAMWLISTVSYASMTCYMFHRLFFWAGECAWNPLCAWTKWLYMGGIVFPMLIVLCYYIQKYYDLLIKRL